LDSVPAAFIASGMNIATISPLLFLLASFTLATVLEPIWSGMERQQAKSVIDMLVGDGKQLFASYFVTKADVYFHNGYYPSIFDQAAKTDSHLSEAAEEHEDHDEHGAHDEHGHDHEHEKAREATDWIEQFGRHFFVSEHSHIKSGNADELLPWFKISAELDPHRVETYTVAAFWLRTTLKKVNEAEEFLREGWKANPDSYAILFELGRLYESDRHDHERARNLWELALKKWDEQEKGKEHPDTFAREQILAHLVDVEYKTGDWRRCLQYLEQLAPISPHPEDIRKQIDDVKTKLKGP
jgi:tetratricopeptide (TPR) repeat protein